MNNPETKQKKGIANTVAIIFVVLVLIAGAAFGAYKLFFEDQKYDLAETEPVETMEIGTTETKNLDELGKEGLMVRTKEATDIMQGSGATFFYMEYTEEFSEGYLTLFQTDKATFSEMSEMGIAKAAKKMTKSVDALLNASAGSLPGDPFMWHESNILARNLYPGEHVLEEMLNEMFGGNLRQYFKDHNLDLKCENLELKKMGYWGFDEAQYTGDAAGEIVPRYFFVFECDLTTEAAEGDLSATPFLPPAGETRHATIKSMFQTSYGNDVCEVIYIE